MTSDGAAQGEAWRMSDSPHGNNCIYRGEGDWVCSTEHRERDRVTALEQAMAHERELREAAEAEATKDVDFWTQQAADNAKECNALRTYSTRLLAALVAQRQALEEIRDLAAKHYDQSSWYRLADAALATDHAALLAEGETLGVTP